MEVIYHSGLHNFCNMIILLPKSQTRHPARATHAFLKQRNFTNPSSYSHFFFAYEVAQSLHENNMSGANTRSVLARFGDNNWEKGEDFVKNFLRQKTCVGDGGELERARAG